MQLSSNPRPRSQLIVDEICPETSVRNYHYRLRNVSEERRSNFYPFLMKFWFFRQIFIEVLNIQFYGKAPSASSRRYMSTDGQKTEGTTKLIGAFRDYESASKVYTLILRHPRTWWLFIKISFSKINIQNILIGYCKIPGTVQSLTLTALTICTLYVPPTARFRNSLCFSQNVFVSCDTHNKYGLTLKKSISRLAFVAELECCLYVERNDFIFTCLTL